MKEYLSFLTKPFVPRGVRAVPPRRAAPAKSGPRSKPPTRASGPGSRALPELERIGSAADIEPIRSIFTGTGGQYELQDAIRKHLIAVVHESGHASVLVDSESYYEIEAHLDSVRARLRTANIRVQRTGFATPSLIAALYQSERGRASNSDDTASYDEAKLFDEFIRYGESIGASDLHAVVQGQTGKIRYRVNGVMEMMRGPTNGVFTAVQVSGALGYGYNKLMGDRTNSHSSFNVDEMQSVMIPCTIDDAQLNLRWQSARGYDGFTVYIRYLRENQNFPADKFEDFGYSEDQAGVFAQVGNTRKGMILICGETNSGKSTTTEHFIKTLPNRDKLNIILVEDPTEKRIEGSSLQISLQRKMNDATQKIKYDQVKAVLVRSDPDLVGVGEIRDVESGACARAVMESGHQVIATSHLPGIMDAFIRLASPEIGFPMDTLTRKRFWSLLVVQSLVPTLCDCSEHEIADVTIPEITNYIRERFRIDTSKMRTLKEGGCPRCGHRGTKGQTLVAEVYQPSRKFLEAMRKGDDYGAEAEWRSNSDGLFDTPRMAGKTLFEHALYKAFMGLIDPREVERFELLDQFEIFKVGVR